MAKNTNLRFIALIGGVIGLIAVFIGLLPSEMNWWWFKQSFPSFSTYLNLFGYFTNSNGDITYAEDILILISGMIFLSGSILIMLAAFKETKVIAILSGILMIVGLVLFCLALNSNADWENVNTILDILNNQSTVFSGSILIWSWGLGWGFYLGCVGAGIGLIGSFLVD